MDNLAAEILEARRRAGWTQAELAERVGIAPSYVSRLESAAWERGGPWPSDDVLRAVARALDVSSSRLLALRQEARRRQDDAARPHVRTQRGGSSRYAVTTGDAEVRRAAQAMLERNPPRGSIRVLSGFLVPGRAQGGDAPGDDGPAPYEAALAKMLAEDTAAVLYRVCPVAPDDVESLRAMAEQLAGGRAPADVRNVRIRACFAPPPSLDVLVGEHEAIIAAPDRRGNPGLRACVLVDDPDFVRAIRDWYDEFVWEPDGDYVTLRYDRLDEAIDEVQWHLTPRSADTLGSADRGLTRRR